MNSRELQERLKAVGQVINYEGKVALSINMSTDLLGFQDCLESAIGDTFYDLKVRFQTSGNSRIIYFPDMDFS